jgi:hypothetical protein
VGVAVVAAVLTCVERDGSGVGSSLGVVDTRRILGVGVAVVATVVTGVDCIDGASKIILSRPYVEMKIAMRETPRISLCFSIRLDFTAPSYNLACISGDYL